MNLDNHAGTRTYFGYRLMRDLFSVQTERFSDQAAMYYREGKEVRQVSFGELRRAVFSLGGWLWSQGLRRKHIAVVSNNSYPYAVLIWALLCGDNTGVLVDFRLDEEQLRSHLDLADADVVFCDAERAPRLANCGRPVFSMEALQEKFCWNGPELAEYEAYSPEEEAIALMLFSSGTTGRSKAVMISQRAFAEGTRTLTRYGVIPDKEYLLQLPLFHIMALICLFVQNIAAGYGMFINTDGRRLLSDMAYIKPKAMVMVPAQMEVIHHIVQANGVEATRALLGGELKSICVGGAAMKTEVADSMKQLGLRITSGYGMTEVMIVAPANELAERPDTALCPAPSVEIRIDQPDANGSGEILIRGNTLFSGYYKDPQATAEAFTHDGWFCSGDIGHFDADGYLYITGRKKNIIILGSGENVCPEELEDQLLRASVIAECRVFELNDVIGVEIYPNDDAFPADSSKEDKISQINTLVRAMNAQNPSSHYISKVFLRATPFEKTALGKVRRDIVPLMEEQI